MTAKKRTFSRRFEALSRGIYPLNDEKLPEVFGSTKLSCEVDVDKLQELQKELGELGHKKKSATKPEEIDELLEKYNVNIFLFKFSILIRSFFFSPWKNVERDTVEKRLQRKPNSQPLIKLSVFVFPLVSTHQLFFV